MKRHVTFEKISANLYNVRIDGRESVLSVYFEDGWFSCEQPGFFNLSARTLEDMRQQISMEIAD